VTPRPGCWAVWRALTYPVKKSFLSMRIIDYKKKYIDEISTSQSS
jgi:hypothetical protein